MTTTRMNDCDGDNDDNDDVEITAVLHRVEFSKHNATDGASFLQELGCKDIQSAYMIYIPHRIHVLCRQPSLFDDHRQVVNTRSIRCFRRMTDR